MKVFIKRFWGFDPIYWPVVSFSLRGSLETLLEASSPGDLMAFVGTKTEQTDEQEQGKLLGRAEFGRRTLHSREALPPKTFAEADKGLNGDIKWPYSVLIARALRFTDEPRPEMTEVLGRQLPMSAISNAVLLSEEEQRRVLALPREEVDAGVTEAIREERGRIAEAVGPGATMGPIPSSFMTTMIRDADRRAFTYAFRFGSRDVWKVGWAHEPAARFRELNAHVPHEVLGQRWGGGFTQAWASAEQAYEMEQRILGSFEPSLRIGERVQCSEAQIEAAWRKAWRG
jgi:hypothetical protein